MILRKTAASIVSTIIVLVMMISLNRNSHRPSAPKPMPIVIEQQDTVKQEKWTLAAENVIGTVYNAEPGQCDSDCAVTASMFRLDLDDVLGHRIIAMERTFMKKLGIEYGDIVKVEGTGEWDGVWQVQDTMNSRFKGQKKIDFLVPGNIRTGKWNNITLYTISDSVHIENYKSLMAGPLNTGKTEEALKLG